MNERAKRNNDESEILVGSDDCDENSILKNTLKTDP